VPADDSDLTTALREALAHLDDPPHLERLGIASRLRRSEQDAGLSHGQALRRALRLAIASLDPGVEATDSPIKARSYQVLYRYAISRESMVSIGMSLGISARQAYRELNTAIERLGHVLSPMLREQALAAPDSPADEEGQFAWLAAEPLQTIALSELLEQVLEPILGLAAQHHVRLVAQGLDLALTVRAKRVVLRQSVINLLSHAIRSTQNGKVTLDLGQVGPDACLTLSYLARTAGDTPADNSPYTIALRMLRFADIRCERHEQDDGSTTVRLRVPGSRRARILLVDDSQGLVHLYSRYLAGQPYDVHGATDLDSAVRATQEIAPDAILLDIMMPGHDGWEVLQAIRTTTEGRQAKVIICSVIDDPELAHALGADGFLNKPLTQATLVQALSSLLSSCK